MALIPAIENRIRELGGSITSVGLPLKETLLSISFPHYLYREDWGLYGVDEYFAQHRAIYDADRDEFLDQIESHYFSRHDFACGQHIWQPAAFTPFTPDTSDFKEWDSFMSQHADLSVFRDVCGDGILEFVQLIHSYGFPDHYYVCLQDPVQDNPTVFGTDHEEFFQEISDYGPLARFLERYCTRSEFREIVSDYVKTLA
jgi:hypothetical protein